MAGQRATDWAPEPCLPSYRRVRRNKKHSELGGAGRAATVRARPGCSNFALEESRILGKISEQINFGIGRGDFRGHTVPGWMAWLRAKAQEQQEGSEPGVRVGGQSIKLTATFLPPSMPARLVNLQ